MAAPRPDPPAPPGPAPRPDPPGPPPPPGGLDVRVRADLHAAMARRDTPTVRTLRTLLAAFANAEAPPAAQGSEDAGLPTPPVVGRLVEHPRLVLGDEERRAIVRHEIADRRDTAAQYVQAGRPDAADDLHAQIRLLEPYL